MSLWDLYQHGQIRGLRASQASAEREATYRARRQDAEVENLEERVERLSTLLEALWGLCRDRLGLTDEQLTAAVQAVVEQQAADFAAGPVRCSCGAAIGAELDRCQFCGAPSPRAHFPFDG